MEQNNYTLSTENNQQKRKPYSHLTLTQRKQIEYYCNLKYDKNYHGPKITCSYIASQVGVNKSTISRELKKGAFKKSWSGGAAPSTRYVYDVAQRKTIENSKRSHYSTKITEDNIDIKNIIKISKRENISIENAVYIYEKETNRKCPVCLKTLYNYAHKNLFKLHKINFGFYKKNKKQNFIGKMIQKGLNISQRPIEAEKRLEFGHFEGDLIIGTKNGSKFNLLTLTDRKTRFEIVIKIQNKSSKSVVNALNDLEVKLGTENFCKLFKSITFDNGTEFRDIKGMEISPITNKKRLQTYFANPYHSWERGTNENCNRLVRRYFPKGTDFENVSQKTINLIINKINYCKRHCLANNSSIEEVKKTDNEIFNIISLLDSCNPFSNIMSYLNL